MAEALVTAIRTLSSDHGYKEIASLVDEVPLLNEQIETKNNEANELRAEIASIKARHVDLLQENLGLYHTQHNKLEAEKSELDRKVSGLTSTVREKDDAIAELQRTVTRLRSQLDQSGNLLQKEQEKVTVIKTGIKNIQQSQKTKDTEIDKLKENLRDEKLKVASAEFQITGVQQEVASLRQTVQIHITKLSEIEGFTTKLHEQDEAVW